MNTAPTAREQELTAETQRAQAALAAKDAEIDALKKQVVPNGQTFGNLGGVGQAPVGDMGTMMKGNLDSGQPLSEEAGKAFDAWMADDKLW